jgi:hypothetical protein
MSMAGDNVGGFAFAAKPPQAVGTSTIFSAKA